MKSFKKEENEPRHPFLGLVGMAATIAGYYFLFKLIILPRFVSAETIEFLTTSTVNVRRGSILFSVSVLLAVGTWVFAVVMWDYLEERRKK